MASLPLVSTQLGVVGKLAESVLNPTVHVANKDVTVLILILIPEKHHSSPVSTWTSSH